MKKLIPMSILFFFVLFISYPFRLEAQNELPKGEQLIIDYKIGELTEAQFFNDGWKAEDAFLGRIGIIEMIRASNQLGIALGTLNKPSGRAGSEMLSLAKLLDREIENNEIKANPLARDCIACEYPSQL